MTSSTQATSTPKVAVNDIGSEEEFLAAIDQTIKYFNDGDIVEGTVVKVDRDEVLLDIGYKTEGVIPSRELSIKHDVDPHEVVKTGEQIEALVLQKEDKEGRLILSKKRAQYERAWGTIERIKEEDGVVTGTVIEVVKGGLILDIGLRGFLPASLVEMRRVRDLQPYVGREIEAKIIELDKNRNNVVLSRRAWLEQTQSEVRHTFLNTLRRGQIRKGVVSSIVNFGAFVDLGGVDGLVHVSELSWKHIDHPGEVVEVGQEVTVEVLDVDMDRERVSLSLKSTQEDPWQQFARTHQIGQVVPGRVTKLVPFGAFVRVEEGIEGLVHISELADRHVEIPEQVVQVGEEIFVKIIDIDLDRRRISLSLKQANEGTVGEAVGDDFDPTLYGMPATYDEAGNYEYPEGFDPETGEWLPGYDIPARGVGAAVRRGPRPLRGAPPSGGRVPRQGRGRGRRRGRRRGGRGCQQFVSSSSSPPAARPRGGAAAPRRRTPARPAAPWPPTRPWPPSATSSPARAKHAPLTLPPGSMTLDGGQRRFPPHSHAAPAAMLLPAAHCCSRSHAAPAATLACRAPAPAPPAPAQAPSAASFVTRGPCAPAPRPLLHESHRSHQSLLSTLRTQVTTFRGQLTGHMWSCRAAKWRRVRKVRPVRSARGTRGWSRRRRRGGPGLLGCRSCRSRCRRPPGARRGSPGRPFSRGPGLRACRGRARRSTWTSGGTSTTITRSNSLPLPPSASRGTSCTMTAPSPAA